MICVPSDSRQGLGQGGGGAIGVHLVICDLEGAVYGR